MLNLDDWVGTQLHTIYEAVQDSSLTSDDEPTSPNKHPLDQALDKTVLAVAAYRRAGQHFAQKSEAFWVFVTGSWDRQRFDRAVDEAAKTLPKRVSVQRDLFFAEGRIEEAIMVLRRGGDKRDAEVLAEALEVYHRNGEWW